MTRGSYRAWAAECDRTVWAIIRNRTAHPIARYAVYRRRVDGADRPHEIGAAITYRGAQRLIGRDVMRGQPAGEVILAAAGPDGWPREIVDGCVCGWTHTVGSDDWVRSAPSPHCPLRAHSAPS